MSPISQPPPVVWTAPVSPMRIVREYRPVAPYAAGGHRGIDLRARPGQPVRSPCRGIVAFRGAVAGGPPTVTIRCGKLRATVQRVRPSVVRGAAVVSGGAIGSAAGEAVDLSARESDGTYLDPAALLRRSEPHAPPVAVPRRPGAPTRRTHLPARVVDRALVTPRGAPAPSWGRVEDGASADVPLGVVGTGVAASAMVALALGAARRRHGGPRQAPRALPARVQR